MTTNPTSPTEQRRSQALQRQAAAARARGVGCHEQDQEPPLLFVHCHPQKVPPVPPHPSLQMCSGNSSTPPTFKRPGGPILGRGKEVPRDLGREQSRMVITRIGGLARDNLGGDLEAEVTPIPFSIQGRDISPISQPAPRVDLGRGCWGTHLSTRTAREWSRTPRLPPPPTPPSKIRPRKAGAQLRGWGSWDPALRRPPFIRKGGSQ